MRKGPAARAFVAVAIAGILAGTAAVAVATNDNGTGETTTPATSTATGSPEPTATPTPTPTPGGACTPGYWKNHLDDWEVITPDTTLGALWAIPASLSHFSNVTAEEALSFPGGRELDGAARIYFRAGVAALLNAFADPDFEPSAGTILVDGNNALATESRATLIALAATLDDANNASECTRSGANTTSR